MNLSTITKPLDELGDANAPIGSRPWLLFVANEIRKTLYDKEQTGRRLQDLVEVFKEHAGWQEFGYLTWEEYCESRLQVEAQTVDAEVVLRAQGRPKKDDNYNVLSPQQQGTSADYLTARIARDRPDILEGMKEGKYRSVRQAAIEAGIVHAKIRYSLPDDPRDAGRYLAERVDREWFDVLIDSYYKAIGG